MRKSPVTAVIECPICHHTGHLSVPADWKKEIDGRSIMSACQVPVQMRPPNNPKQIMAMPCGCTGKGIPTPAPVAEKLPELAKCFNPGCQEFALLSSSFCSDDCKMQMAALVSGTGPGTLVTVGPEMNCDEWMGDY